MTTKKTTAKKAPAKPVAKKSALGATRATTKKAKNLDDLLPP